MPGYVRNGSKHTVKYGKQRVVSDTYQTFGVLVKRQTAVGERMRMMTSTATREGEGAVISTSERPGCAATGAG